MKNNHLNLMVLLKKCLPHIEQKELFYDLIASRINIIKTLRDSTEFNHLIYCYKGSTADVNFNNSIDGAIFFQVITSSRINLNVKKTY